MNTSIILNSGILFHLSFRAGRRLCTTAFFILFYFLFPTCRKYKLKDVVKEHLAIKEVKKEAKEEPEETFEEESKIKDEPVSPQKPASSSPAPGTPPTA